MEANDTNETTQAITAELNADKADTTEQDAKISQDGTTPFKSFATQADFDREIQQRLKTHEENLKGKLTPEIRKQLEKEANMTAEQKYEEQLKQLDAEKKALAKDKSRNSTESLFVKAGIGEAERNIILDCCVTEDAEQSAKNAQAVIDAIDKATKEQIKKAMADVKPPKTDTENKDEENDASVKFAKDRAAKRAESEKASNKALDYYINGGKKA